MTCLCVLCGVCTCLLNFVCAAVLCVYYVVFTLCVFVQTCSSHHPLQVSVAVRTEDLVTMDTVTVPMDSLAITVKYVSGTITPVDVYGCVIWIYVCMYVYIMSLLRTYM